MAQSSSSFRARVIRGQNFTSAIFFERRFFPSFLKATVLQLVIMVSVMLAPIMCDAVLLFLWLNLYHTFVPAKVLAAVALLILGLGAALALAVSRAIDRANRYGKRQDHFVSDLLRHRFVTPVHEINGVPYRGIPRAEQATIVIQHTREKVNHNGSTEASAS